MNQSLQETDSRGRRRVLVTGLGCITADGGNLETFWSRQLAGHPSITVIKRFDTDGLAVRHAAQVDDTILDSAEIGLPFRRADRYTRLAGFAIDAALADAGLVGGKFDETRAGLVLGSGLGGVMFQEEQMWEVVKRGTLRLHPHSVPRISPTALLSTASCAFGLRGPGHVVTTACASGAHAIGQGLRLIQHGEADMVIAGGTEGPLTAFSITAFASLGVLAHGEGGGAPACRPFDRARTGFVLGEGAAALVLESLDHAMARGARSYCEVAGYGRNLGGHHAVHARPDGADAASAITSALRDADMPADQVEYVNAHGTGTAENDVAESRALHAALGPCAARVPVSSSKPMLGHTLGAAGAIEAVVTCLAVARGGLPPTANHHDRDPSCELDVVAGASRPVHPRAALSNSFGFGNVNVSLLFARSPQ